MSGYVLVLNFLVLVSIQGVSQGQILEFGCSYSEFSYYVSRDINTDPWSFATGDIDGDGDFDAVVANRSGNDVSVLNNNGRGVFELTESYEVGLQPVWIILADLDGDSYLDVATANEMDDSVTILVNTGSGMFNRQDSFAVGNEPEKLVAADLDGDSDLDIATANRLGNSVTLLFNDGAGGFARVEVASPILSPLSIAAGDLDGDSDNDLIVGHSSAVQFSDAFSVLLNDGAGEFGEPTEFETGRNPRFVALADFDGDLDLDLVTSNQNSFSMTVFINNGRAEFSDGVSYNVGGSPQSVKVGDMDGDLDNDIAIVSISDRTGRIFINDGSGTFAPTFTYDTLVGPRDVELVDVDDDSDLDFLVLNDQSSESITVLLNNGDVSFPTNYEFVMGFDDVPDSLSLADVDGDSDLDIVTTDQSSSGINVLFNDGDGFIEADVGYTVGSFPRAVALADFNDDGLPDIAASTCVNDMVSILFNIGNGLFELDAQYFAIGTGLSDIATEDIDGDGDIDLVVTNRLNSPQTDPGFVVFMNDGNGQFSEAVQYVLPSGAETLTSGDFDLDGDVDVAMSVRFADSVAVSLNHGDGTFADPILYDVGNRPFSITSADIDNDGDLDLATANLFSDSTGVGNDVCILLNNGDGSFADPMTFIEGRGTHIASADYDRDGDIDLAIAAGQEATLMINQGNLEFRSGFSVRIGDGENRIVFGDMDGDDDLDLVTSNRFADSISIVFNDCFLLGDINMDGRVDLLDIDPFVNLLRSGSYAEEADVNMDGAVNLLDIAPFFELFPGD
ncbi:MAG: FG-GAP-like repeat-containing protein [Planctomycetota bacterium]